MDHLFTVTWPESIFPNHIFTFSGSMCVLPYIAAVHNLDSRSFFQYAEALHSVVSVAIFDSIRFFETRYKPIFGRMQ